MCVVCETRKKQIELMKELMMDVEKREIAILVRKTDEVARLGEEVNRRLAKMLALQDELPDVFTDVNVLSCVLSKLGGKRKDATHVKTLS
jgi:hypothetical protein